MYAPLTRYVSSAEVYIKSLRLCFWKKKLTKITREILPMCLKGSECTHKIYIEQIDSMGQNRYKMVHSVPRKNIGKTLSLLFHLKK